MRERAINSHWNTPNPNTKVGTAVREPYNVGIGLRQDAKNVHSSVQVAKSYKYLKRQAELLDERQKKLAEETIKRNNRRHNLK